MSSLEMKQHQWVGRGIKSMDRTMEKAHAQGPQTEHLGREG